MRNRMLFAALAALAIGAGPVSAQTSDQAALVESYYERFLHRRADPVGMQTWLSHFSWGESAESIQAQLLASDEVYQIHGSNPRGFVVGLYQDVLGRNPNPNEVWLWLNYWNQVGGQRFQVSNAFMIAARTELANQAATRFYAPQTTTTVPPLPVPPAPIGVPWRP
jgi:hypothetical protein